MAPTAEDFAANATEDDIRAWLMDEDIPANDRNIRGYRSQYGLWVANGRIEQPEKLSSFVARAEAAGVEQIPHDSTMFALFWKAAIDTVLNGRLVSNGYDRKSLETRMGQAFQKGFGMDLAQIRRISEIDPYTNVQVTGDDLRTANFWKAALSAADGVGFCEAFDQLAAQVGGPRRDNNRIAVEARREREPA